MTAIINWNSEVDVNKKCSLLIGLMVSFVCIIVGGKFVQGAEKPVKVRAGYVSPTTDNVIMVIAQKQGSEQAWNRGRNHCAEGSNAGRTGAVE